MSLTFPFYAEEEEVFDLWDWLADVDGIRLEEATASTQGEKRRKFASFPREEWKARSPERPCRIVALPGSFSSVTRERIGYGGRMEVVSPVWLRIMQISPPSHSAIAPFELIYETERSASRAGCWEVEQVSATDWKAFGNLVQSIKQEIGRRYPQRWRNMPVSHGVMFELARTERRLWFWGFTGVPTGQTG